MQNGMCHLQTLSGSIFDRPNAQTEARFPGNHRSDVELALSEAWSWLVTNGLLTPESGTNGRNGWMVLTRRGAKLVEGPGEFRKFQEAAAFPKALIHPSIADKVWLLLARGELEDAVFNAFKAVEVAVRDAGGFALTDIGVPLMRRAFDKTTVDG